KLHAWGNFVEGPVATRAALISTVHQKRTAEEEEAWMENILQKEPVSIEIGEDGIQLLAGVLYQADLDGNGVAERFCYLGSDSETYGPRFIIQGKKYYVGEGYDPRIAYPTGIYVKYLGVQGERQETYYLCDIRKDDGQVEFGLGHWDGGRKTSFLAYDGERMDFIGTVYNIPFATADQRGFGVASRELEQENIANGIWGFDGEGHIGLTMPMSLLQTNWCANVVWELDEASNQLRLLPQEDGLYEISDPWYYAEDPLSEDGFAYYPHLAQDLVIYQERDLQSQTQVLRASEHGPDNKIYFTHTDNEHWIRIVDDAGVAGWFYMEDFDTIRTEEGRVSALDVFGYLNLAG
ncbi:MAG: hypothetical protein J6I64_00015, partial [Lachnospiraceae bacterium]|nr:hypothetical protein [Lachnospiraceae bacterium]